MHKITFRPVEKSASKIKATQNGKFIALLDMVMVTAQTSHCSEINRAKYKKYVRI